ncbi:ATP-dependent rRNA helicase spb4 [Hypoxylon texense]
MVETSGSWDSGDEDAESLSARRDPRRDVLSPGPLHSAWMWDRVEDPEGSQAVPQSTLMPPEYDIVFLKLVKTIATEFVDWE